MRAWARLLCLLCLGGPAAGCFSLIADLTTPDPVQAVDITWANDRALCQSFIAHTTREQKLQSGDLDAPGPHEFVPLLRASTAVVGARWKTSTAIRDGVSYLYVLGEPIRFEDTSALPPVRGAEDGAFDDAIKDAWRHSLFQQTAGGTQFLVCQFVTRRLWHNLAI